MTVPKAEYLGMMGTSRALYLLLFEDAVGALPPILEGDDVSLPLATARSIASMASVLRLSRSTVRGDLSKLINFGWVRDDRTCFFLGHRAGDRLRLLSDLAALRYTGASGLITDIVLKGITSQHVWARIPSERKATKKYDYGNRTWDAAAPSAGKTIKSARRPGSVEKDVGDG